MTFICPVCRQSLTLNGRAYRCAAGHSFDRAREGYVNLLLRLRSATVGDSRGMLAARRAFLSAGYYDALSDTLNAHTLEHIRPRNGGTVLDVGCGEGYYLGRLRRAAEIALPRDALDLAGIDVSREAVRLAARACPEATFAVADAWKLIPVADSAVDVLLSVFSPRNPVEFDRVLAPDGLLVVAIPEPEHLQELRSLPGFLSVPEDKRDTLVQQMTDRFGLAHEESISARMILSPPDLIHLAGMTPSARHLSPDTLSHLETSGPAVVTAGFRVLAFTRDLAGR